MNEEEKDGIKREIPMKWRASTDPANEAAFALLRENDEAQKLLRAQNNTPFASQTPKERERSNARITIKALENAKEYQGLASSQREQLADSYASVGEYVKARQTTKDKEKAKLFTKYHKAVWSDDAKWCEHADDKIFIKENVWSLKEARALPLLQCSVCGFLNVAESPGHLIEKQRIRADVRASRPGGMSIEDAKTWHQQNVKGKLKI